MKTISRYLLGVGTQSLPGGIAAQHPIFNHAIECTWALLEFYMYAHYTSHNNAVLSYMEDALHRFHTLKDVFLLGRAGKKAKAKANALRMELLKKGKAGEETNALTWTPSMKQHEINPWREYISHEIDVSKELDADFNYPKIHLISHRAEQICWYGTVQQYFAKRHVQAHKTNLMTSCNASNHNLNYLPQVITFQCPILCFAVIEFSIQAPAQRGANIAHVCKVLPSGADLTAPLSFPPYA